MSCSASVSLRPPPTVGFALQCRRTQAVGAPTPRAPASSCSAAPPSPTNEAPCMTASVVGRRSPRACSVDRRVRRHRHGVEHLLGLDRRPDDVVAQQRRRPDLGEHVAAEQGSRRLLEQHLGLPAVGHVRRRDLAQPLAADVQHLAVLQRTRRPVAHVVERQVAAEGAEHDLGLRCGRQPGVHRPALVGLDVTEADPAQRLDRDDLGDRLGDQREHRAVPGVEQQRLVTQDEELVERDPDRGDVGHERRDPVDPVGDLVDGGAHLVHASLAFIRRIDPFTGD